MKIAMWALLCVAMLVSWGIAQDNSLTSNSETTQTHAARSLTIWGKVSSDGKTILTDIDSEWIVSNAAALKGFEGRLVRVKCYVDSDRNRIQILTVKDERDSNNLAAHYADSAFRR